VLSFISISSDTHICRSVAALHARPKFKNVRHENPRLPNDGYWSPSAATFHRCALRSGGLIFSIGLVKKPVFAGAPAIAVDSAFAANSNPSG
jgi:hypothetical protein